MTRHLQRGHARQAAEQSEAFSHFHRGPEPVLSDKQRQHLGGVAIHLDGHVEQTFPYPDATRSSRKHPAEQPRRRRSWRHPIRGVIAR